MRPTLILLVLACMPAIGQENTSPTPDNAARGFSGGVPQRFSDALRKLLHYSFDAQGVQTPGKTSASPILRIMAARPASPTCSIPLLNVTPPGTPVPMPNMMPKMAVPRDTPVQTRQPNRASPEPGQIDNMKIVVPAPACPADFGQVSAPRTTP
jgi:hypothetical protein